MYDRIIYGNVILELLRSMPENFNIKFVGNDETMERGHIPA